MPTYSTSGSPAPEEFTPLRARNSLACTVDLGLTSTKWGSVRTAPMREVAVVTLESMALLTVYFSTGFTANFVASPLSEYAEVSLQATSAQLSTLSLMSALPLALRLPMGLVSDLVPVRNQHRKPYIFAGTGVLCAAYLVGAVATAKVVNVMSVDFLCAVQLAATTGSVLCLLMVDTLMLEKSTLFEQVPVRGWMQLKGFIAFYTGTLAGDLLAVAFTTDEIWEWEMVMTKVFAIACTVPLVLIGGTLTGLADDFAAREEVESRDMFGVASEPDGLWIGRVLAHGTRLLRCTCQPVMFLYLLCVSQVENPAWSTFLQNSLNLGQVDQAVLGVLGDVAAWIVLWAYHSYFFAINWRYLFMFTILFGVLLNLSLLLSLDTTTQWLFYQDTYITAGITAGSHAIRAMQKCVAYRMMINLCDGFRAGSFALLTSVLILGTTASKVIGSELETVWDVSSGTLAVHQYSGLRKLTVVCSVLPLLALPFVVLVPRGSLHQWEQLKSNHDTTPPWLAASYFGTILIIFVVGLYDVEEER